MRNILNRITRNFILGEGQDSSPNVFSYIQSLSETLANFRVHTQTEARRLDIAKQHLREIKRNARKLFEQVQILEEKLSVLEESQGE